MIPWAAALRIRGVPKDLRDKLAVLERSSGTSCGTSLTNRDGPDALVEEWGGRDRRLGAPHVPEAPE